MSETLSPKDLEELSEEPLMEEIAILGYETVSRDYSAMNKKLPYIEQMTDDDPPWLLRTSNFLSHAWNQKHMSLLTRCKLEDDFMSALNKWRKGPVGESEFNPAARLNALKSKNQKLLLVGPSGSGKSTVAAEVFIHSLMGYTPYYTALITAREFCNTVSTRAKACSLCPYMNDLKDIGCLLFDDASAANYSDRNTEEFLDLLSARIDDRGAYTIITMHSDGNGLAKRLEAKDRYGNVTNADAVNAIMRRLRTEFTTIDFSKP